MARSDAEYMTASIIPLLKNLLFLSLAYTLASIYDGIWGFGAPRDEGIWGFPAPRDDGNLEKSHYLEIPSAVR